MKNGDYILVIAPSWYKGKLYRKRYCYEHHLAWEKHSGEPVPKGCVIHHKDGNKHNNAFENLELLTIEDHSSLHKQPRKIAVVQCPNCKKIFERELRKLHNKSLAFCCLSCSGKFYGFKRTEKEIENEKKGNIIKVYSKVV